MATASYCDKDGKWDNICLSTVLMFLFRYVIISIIIPPLCRHRRCTVCIKMQTVHLRVHAHKCAAYILQSRLWQRRTEEFSKGATIRLLSDRLSFSSRCGSTKSSHHPYNAPFFLFTLLSVPCFFNPRGYLVPVHRTERVFILFFFSPSMPFLPRPLPFQASIKVLMCNAKILITGILRSHNTAGSPLQLELLPLHCELVEPVHVFVYVLIWSEEKDTILWIARC